MKKIIFICLLLLCLAPLARAKASTTTNLKQKLIGRIIIAVQANGEAYYLNPGDGKIYFLGRPNDAYGIMRNQSLGISEKDFSTFNNSRAPKKLAGRIVIRAQSLGQAYYIDPINLKLYSLGNATSAFNVMKKLGLGITNTDLETLLGNTKATNVYTNTAAGFQIILPDSNWYGTGDAIQSHIYSDRSCSSYKCEVAQIESDAAYYNLNDNWNSVQAAHPTGQRFLSMVPGATVFKDINNVSEEFGTVYSYYVTFDTTHKAFNINVYAPMQDKVEKILLPNFSLAK